MTKEICLFFVRCLYLSAAVESNHHYHRREEQAYDESPFKVYDVESINTFIYTTKLLRDGDTAKECNNLLLYTDLEWMSMMDEKEFDVASEFLQQHMILEDNNELVQQ